MEGDVEDVENDVDALDNRLTNEINTVDTRLTADINALDTDLNVVVDDVNRLEEDVFEIKDSDSGM